MRYRLSIFVGLLAAIVSLAATRPIAMRVEIEPVGPDGDATTMSITVQVAPEDRSRLGKDFWIQGLLTRHGERIDRLARAVDMDQNGQASIEVSWPPGDYDLEIEVEGTKRGARGVWGSRITVPHLGPTAPPTPIPTPEPTPVPMAPAPVPAVAAVAAAPTPAPSLPTAEHPPQTPLEEPDTSEIEPEPSPIPEPEPADPEVAAAVSAAAVATGAVADSRSPDPAPSDQSGVEIPQEAIEEGVGTFESPAVDEKAVAEAATATGVAASEIESEEPELVAPPTEQTPATPVPAPAEPTHEPLSAKWPSDPGSADLTVSVTDRNRPILGLGPSAFRVRIGGREVPVRNVGNTESAPLNLGLVANLSPAMADLQDQVSQLLARFSLRTAGGHGEAFLATTTDPSDWGISPNQLAAAVSNTQFPGDANLAEIVATASTRFENRRGRSFLVVITDGSDIASKSDWKAATTTVENAGIPVFVIGLRDSGFAPRARSGLDRIADNTGGRRYFLAGPGMLEMTLDYVGELVDASYVLQFERPDSQKADGEIKIDGADRAWDVDHPRRLPK